MDKPYEITPYERGDIIYYRYYGPRGHGYPCDWSEEARGRITDVTQYPDHTYRYEIYLDGYMTFDGRFIQTRLREIIIDNNIQFRVVRLSKKERHEYFSEISKQIDKDNLEKSNREKEKYIEYQQKLHNNRMNDIKENK